MCEMTAAYFAGPIIFAETCCNSFTPPPRKRHGLHYNCVTPAFRGRALYDDGMAVTFLEDVEMEFDALQCY